MEPCDRWRDALLEAAEGLATTPDAQAHFSTCPACARELALQRAAVEALVDPSPPEMFRLAAPFVPPLIPRRRDRVLLSIGGAGVLAVLMSLHGLLDLGPWTALLASLEVLAPFSRTLFQQAGWTSILALGAGLIAAGWGLKRLLQRA